MFKLKNKTILLISPQSWGKMHISKHHYAIELAQNNKVYFLNPPRRKTFPKITVESHKSIDNLFIVSYSFFFPYNLRFHSRVLFDKLQKYQIKFILNRIKKIDITWCFDTISFSNLNFFNSNISIYHPVDNISGNNQKKMIQTSDFIFSVSSVIIEDLLRISKTNKIKFINHGLSKYFIEKTVVQEFHAFTEKTAYFMGNVLLGSLDREITKKIIIQNPDVRFVFIGAYSDSNISGSDNESVSFVEFLKHAKNVTLKGGMHPKDAVVEICNADVLMVLINPQKDINKGSNSHKILEYLSTGKVIVSNHISTYSDKRYLIEMVDEMHNKKLPELFKKVISHLDYYNSSELQKKRIEFALDNTYEKQIRRIEKIISDKITI